MLFVGQTRFSLFEPGSRAWRLTREISDPEATERYKAELFSEERLTNRCEIFFGHTLPTIDAGSSNYELIHLVSYSDELPTRYKTLLSEAAREYPWLKLDQRTEANRKGINPNKVARAFVGQGVAYGQYRLDDDDILATNYFRQMAKYISDAFVGMRVSLALGVVAQFDNGVLMNPREEYRVNASQGLLKVSRFNNDGKLESPLNTSHKKSDRVSPVVLDSRETSYIRVVHESQDTRVHGLGDDREKRVAVSDRLPAVKESVDLDRLFPVTEFTEDSRKVSST